MIYDLRFTNAEKRRVADGFTLIELLVAITVMVILTAITMISFQGARRRARDGVRERDLNTMRTALEIYREDSGQYPSETTCDSSRGSCGACPCGGTDWNGAIATALEPNYVANLPVDPMNTTTYFYSYEPVCSETSTVCGVSRTCTGCCAYELSVVRETTGTTISVCSP